MFEPFQCILVESTSFVADHWENALFLLVSFKHIRFLHDLSLRVSCTVEAQVEVFSYLVVVCVVEIVLATYRDVDDLGLGRV